VTPSDFLRSVWPSQGIYCLAIPRPTGGFRHYTFDTVEQAVTEVEKRRRGTDLFFNIHTLLEKQVPHQDPEKRAEGKTQTRVQRNMAAARCFFFDLDVGPGDHKYASQVDALAALKEFCKDAGLPYPLVASSGGGLHVYWLLSDPIESTQWRDHANQLRQLAQHYGLRADPARTTDTASILRVVGSFNLKDPNNPREVVALAAGTVTAAGVFVKLVNDALTRAGLEARQAPRLLEAEALGSNLDAPYDGPTPAITAVMVACAQFKRLAMASGNFTEPEWYHTAIGVGRFVQDGHRFIQKMSSGHPTYSPEATIAKIKQSEQRQSGPSSCASVAYHSTVGDSLCVGCPFQGKVHGPIQAALFREEIPAPVVEEVVGDETITIDIPQPPPPWSRSKSGVVFSGKSAEGDEVVTLVYEYDLYPVRRLTNPAQGIEQQVWHVGLPRGEEKDFTVDADALYDTRKFVALIAHQGIYPNKGNIGQLQEYMVAYIAQLQKLVDADAQCNHLGWADDHSRFILPDKILSTDGSAKPAQLSLGAQRASAQVHKKGTLERQVELLRFYNNAEYLPNQFYVLAGLAAPIFYATGHHGVIINASGDAGASKSTSLYTAASLWGQPELYPINGTNNGATVRGRNERVTVLANLPVCVDEITHMPIKDAVDLAMSITQPGHRIRLHSDGVERASLGSYKATIMLATANNSLHSLLSTDNTAGTAGSMRVFEIVFRANHVHQKHEADDFLHELKQNYGHVGELFVNNVIKRLETVARRVREVTKEIDREAKIQSSERFWSATAASVLVAGEIAREMGLLNYSPEVLKRWVVDYQIPYMRGVVKEEYSDPLAIIANYLEAVNNNMLVVRKIKGGQGNLTSEVRRPAGPLLAHYDLDDQMLYILKAGFKDYCTRIGANSAKILDELHELRDDARIIPQKHTRRTLGAGTEYAKAQTWCFALNMAHRDVSGVVDLKVLTGTGGGDQSKGADLKLVQ
jgi:hypothetical protein